MNAFSFGSPTLALSLCLLVFTQGRLPNGVPAFEVADFSKELSQKIVSFVLEGDPNKASRGTTWPQYDEKSRKVAKFGDSTEIVADPVKQSRCDLWQSAPYRPDPDEDLLVKQGARKAAWEL